MTMRNCADCFFVTYDGLPHGDPHDRALADYLRGKGIRADPAVWTDDSVDWASARACVIRSTWDYHLSPQRFLAWLDAVASQTTVYNDPSLIRWNSHKFYLRDLARDGVPIVPTVWLERGTTVSLDALRLENGWDELLLKPAYGASSTDVLHVATAPAERAAGQQHLERLLERQDVLVQPFLHTLAAYPERALIFVEGSYTHAVLKEPFQTALPSGEAGDAPPVDASPAEIAVAERAIACLPVRPLFCRVDLVRDGPSRGGNVCVLEFEVIEPTLFLTVSSASVAALGDALLRRL